MSELAKALRGIFDANSAMSLAEKQKKTIHGVIKKKMDRLLSGPDPFLDLNVYRFEAEKNGKNKDFKPGEARKPKGFVSLAKALLIFVVEPLLNSPNFDEIQLMFYQFNTQAARAGDTCIGSFPIEVKLLSEIFEDHVQNKRNVDMSINEFVLLLQTAVINDPRSSAYGLADAYKPRELGKPPVLVSSNTKEIGRAHV